MRLVHFLLSAILTISVVTASAQKAKVGEYIQADKAYRYGYFNDAIALYKKAYVKVKTLKEKGDILYKQGECHRYLGHFTKAIDSYRRSLKSNKAPDLCRLRLADVLKMQERYSEAHDEYKRYYSESGDERGKFGIEACEMAQIWKEEPTRFKVNKVEGINMSAEYDFAAAFYDKKEKSLVFSSTRKSGTGAKESTGFEGDYPDLFYTAQDKKSKKLHKGWDEPKPLAEGVNSEWEESSPTLDKKFATIYFNRCPQPKKKVAGCEIWQATKSGTDWGAPELVEGLKPADSTIVSVLYPFVSPNGKYLFFSSDLMANEETNTEAYGGFDIWYSEYDRKSKTWGAPKNAGPEINSSGNEIHPTMDKNGNLYFSSDALPGMGGYDIFKAAKKGEDPKKLEFEKPVNLKYPINSSTDDYRIIFKRNGTEGFFTSNRDKKSNKDDIYSFNLPPIEHTLIVRVFNKEDKKPLEGIKVILKGGDGDETALYPDQVTDATGSYSFGEISRGDRFVKGEADYDITVEKKPEAVTDKNVNPNKITVLSKTQSITSKGIEQNKIFTLDFYVEVIKDEPIVLPEVRYDLGSHKLQVIDSVINSKDSLNYVYNLLKDNPTLKVKLMSHTDSRGGDDANQKLSQNRAEACVCYLVFEKGVNPTRMTAEGFGEKQPRTVSFEGKETLLTEKFINQYGRKGKKKNKETFEMLHQFNRRTEMDILDWNWKAPAKEETQKAMTKWEKTCKDLKVYDNKKLFKGNQAEENQKKDVEKKEEEKEETK